MYGLNIDPRNSKGNPDPAEMRDLGVEILRYSYIDQAGGDQLDPAQAQFYREKVQAYKQVGVDSLLILTYDTYPHKPNHDAGDGEWDAYIDRFARRCGQIAQLLAPFKPALQIWNEPDHPPHAGYAPTVREAVFGRMLRRANEAIKAVDPAITVVAGGLAAGNPSWLTRVVQSVGGAFPADAIAFHPYGQRPARDWPSPNWAFGYVGDLLNNYYRAGANRPIWITEMGIKEGDVDNDRQKAAEFLRRYYRLITTYYSDKVKQLIWFCYGDGMVAPFGLLDGAGQRKPAYQSFRDVAPRRAAPTPPIQPIIQPTPTPAFATASTPLAPPPLPSIFGTPVSPTPMPVIPVQPPITPAPAVIINEPLEQFKQQVAAWQSQANQLQQQLAQFQGQIQQLLAQQAQFQTQLQQFQGQPVSSAPLPPSAFSPQPFALAQDKPSTLTRPAPPIQNITSQLKRHPAKQFPTRPLSQIQRIIIHHTAIVPAVGADRVAVHRVDQQDWPGIGYHYFITGDGQLQQTNELTTVSTHAGQYDPVAIGVCFAGDFTSAIPSQAQIEAGAQLIAWLLPQFGLTLAAVFGYKELVVTQSPGAQWDAGQRWGDRLRARIQAYLS